ncbi:MAG: hypothetical protein AAFP22_23105, partial [Planctomycetota bacterium]
MLLTWLTALAMAGSVAVIVDSPTAPPDLAADLTDELSRLDAGLDVEPDDIFMGAPGLERTTADLARAVRDRRYRAVVALGAVASEAARSLRNPRIPVVAAVDLRSAPPPRGVVSLPLRLDVERA